MTWEITEYETREAWLAARRQYVTSSDVPVILGLGYIDPFTLWLRKVRGDQADDTDMEVRFDMGHAAEPVIAKHFEKKTGRSPFRLADGPHLVTNPALPWAAVSPDFLVMDGAGEPGVVEGKTDSLYASSGYEKGPSFLYANAQVHLGMMVLEFWQGWVATMFGMGNRFAVYPVERHAALCALIEERCSRFHAFVVAKEPPDQTYITEHEELYRALTRIFDQETGEEITLDSPDDRGWLDAAARYLEIGEDRAKLKKEQEQIRNLFVLRMGNACFARIPGFSKVVRLVTERGGAEAVDTRWENRVLRFVNDPLKPKGKKP
jgi:predicted phage-related endonuclease